MGLVPITNNVMQ